MVSLAEIGLRIYGIYAHIPHHPADFLSVDADPMITADNLCNSPITPGGVVRMQLVDPPHYEQIPIGYLFIFWGIPVEAASIDIQKLSLTADSEF